MAGEKECFVAESFLLVISLIENINLSSNKEGHIEILEHNYRMIKFLVALFDHVNIFFDLDYEYHPKMSKIHAGHMETFPCQNCFPI